MNKSQLRKKNITWWIGTILCVSLFSTIGVYAYQTTRQLTHGVELIASIDRSSSAITFIKGNARGATYITLNGREIFIDSYGNFNEPLALLPGLSVVTLATQDKFGKMKDKQFQVIYNGTSGTVAAIEKPIINN